MKKLFLTLITMFCMSSLVYAEGINLDLQNVPSSCSGFNFDLNIDQSRCIAEKYLEYKIRDFTSKTDLLQFLNKFNPDLIHLVKTSAVSVRVTTKDTNGNNIDSYNVFINVIYPVEKVKCINE